MPVSGRYAASNCWRLGSAIVSSPPFTMSCFMRTSDRALASTIMAIVNSGSSGDLNAYRLINSGAAAAIVARAGDGSSSTSATSPRTTKSKVPMFAAGIWFAVNDYRACVDGVFEGTASTSRTASGLNRTCIGLKDNTANSEPLNAKDDDWIYWPSIWNVALGRKELVALANGTPPWLIHPEALLFCNDGKIGNGLLLDRTKNRNHFTQVGALTMHPDPAFVRWVQFKGKAQVAIGGFETIPKAVSDSVVSLSEAVTAIQVQLSRTDSIALTEAINTLSVRLTRTDSVVTLSDAISVSVPRAVSDALVTLTESLSPSVRVAVLDAVVTLSEASLVAVIKAVTDSVVTISESIVGMAVLLAVLDQVGLLDEVISGIEGSLSVADALEIVDGLEISRPPINPSTSFSPKPVGSMTFVPKPGATTTYTKRER